MPDEPSRFWVQQFVKQNADLLEKNENLKRLSPGLKLLYEHTGKSVGYLSEDLLHKALAGHPDPVRFIYDEHQMFFRDGGPLSENPDDKSKRQYFSTLRTWTGPHSEGVGFTIRTAPYSHSTH